MDGDAVDVMIAPPGTRIGSDAFVIEQRKPDGDLNQHKVFACYATAEDAANAFRLVWGSAALGTIRQMAITDLYNWLAERRPTQSRIRAVT